MTAVTLAELAAKMKDIDIAYLVTHAADGRLASRPMSNNQDVEYDGDSYYFVLDSADSVAEIEDDPNVLLAFNGKDGFYVSVVGEGEVVREKQALREHWTPDLDAWFEDGVDTPGLAMIRVRARSIKYWDGEDNGEVSGLPVTH